MHVNETRNKAARKINQKQKQILFSAMATNRKILDSNMGDKNDRQMRKEAWRILTLKLNMAGFQKHTSQWRKVWTDLRLAMRKKYEKAKKSPRILTEYDRRVIDACGMLEKSCEHKEKTAEEINSFLIYLQEELVKENELLNGFEGGMNELNYNYELNNEPSNFVDWEEKSIECISDDDGDDDANRHEEFLESSVQCISDDEIVTYEVKMESDCNLSDVDPEELPQLSEELPPTAATSTSTSSISKDQYQKIFEESINYKMKGENDEDLKELQQLAEDIKPILPDFTPELPPRTAISTSSTSKPNRVKNSSLKEIKKMHRNLLRESKKQTALLRKLVRAVQKKEL